MIELRNLTKSFTTTDGPVDALRNVNLTIGNGDIYGIIGMSGAGKSTLINNIFRVKLAGTGIGQPVTTVTEGYSIPGVPVTIFDTRGFELGSKEQQLVKTDILRLIKDGVEAKDINRNIHCILYCLNAASNRIEEEEINWIRQFTDEANVFSVPVVIVLTQAVAKKKGEDLQAVIEKQSLKVKGIIPVLAEDYPIDDELLIKAYGLDRLINTMTKVLSAELRLTLQNVQIASLKNKITEAESAVHKFVAAAGTVAATPIPFSDAAVLVPVQVAMIARITAIFGISVTKSILTGIVSSVAGTAGATYIGRSFVSGILKFIPGIGTIAGGVISATTAAAITEALGQAYIQLMIMIYKGELEESSVGSDEFKRILKEKMKML